MADSPFDAEIIVGRIERAEKFEEARKPEMAKLWIDTGDEKVRSAAQLLYNHSIDELEGKQVLCCVSLGEVNIAGFVSEALTLGVPDENGNPVLVAPEEEVPEGGELY